MLASARRDAGPQMNNIFRKRKAEKFKINMTLFLTMTQVFQIEKRKEM